MWCALLKLKPQRILAEAVTRLVHGDAGLLAAQRITQALFNEDLSSLGESDFVQLRQDGLPSSELARQSLGDTPLTQLLADAGMAASGKQVKDALARAAVSINGLVVGESDIMRTGECLAAEVAHFGRFYLVKLGKKKYHLFEVV